MVQPAPDMRGKVVAITGANRGIGLAAAGQLAGMGATVVMVVRSVGHAEEAARDIRSRTGNEQVHVVAADLASQRSIREAASAMRNRWPALDVLVNNAGTVQRRRTLTADGIESVLAVNHLAYFLLTHELLGPLQAAGAARVVNVSSEAHQGAHLDFDNLQLERGYGGLRAYGQSKLANVLFTYELARRLEGTRVTANCLHPGVVATNLLMDYLPFGFLTRPIARLVSRDPEEGADTLVYLASSPEVEGVTGRYFIRRQEARSSDVSYDATTAVRLWEESERLTGLAAPAPAH